MGVFQWAEDRAKRMTIWDIGVLKVYCVLFGMIVGAYLSTLKIASQEGGDLWSQKALPSGGIL